MERTLGIDVSRWQDNNSTAQKMDFVKAYNAGARFVFIKASQQLWADEDILYNWKAAKEAGLLRGAYHFLTWDKPGRDQARYHWSIIQSDPGELPPVCDFESWGTIPTNAYAILWEYLNELKVLSGKTPIIYTGYYFWLTYGNKGNLNWSQFPLWLAYYAAESVIKTPAPWTNWTFWQYTSKGDGLKFGAESLNLDMNYFNGSYQDLLNFAKIVVPPTGGAMDIEALWGEVNDLQNLIVEKASIVQSDVFAEITDTLAYVNEENRLLMEKLNIEAEALKARVIQKLTELQNHMNTESEYIKKLIKP